MYGNKHRNRAVHGDVVAAELLPKSEWRGKVSTLTEGQPEEKNGDDTQSQPMPTGKGGGEGASHLKLLNVFCQKQSKVTRSLPCFKSNV